jgi:hypothetical protein
MTKLPSNAKGRKLLLKLADLLEADAKNKKGIKFNLEVVCEPADLDLTTDDPTALGFGKNGPTLDCKTAACAMGLAAISKKFKNLGYELNADVNGQYYNIEVTYKKSEGDIYTGFDSAAQAMFDIEWEDVQYLFVSDYYPNKYIRGKKGELAVAKRIRDYVKGKFDKSYREEEF